MNRYKINRNRSEKWKADIAKSVLFYNDWFLKFAPDTYIGARSKSMTKVEEAFRNTNYFNEISCDTLMSDPQIISILRMATTPPIARDRLTGLAGLPKSLLKSLEDGKIPLRMPEAVLRKHLDGIAVVIHNLLDRDIMPWINQNVEPQNDVDKCWLYMLSAIAYVVL